MPRRPGHKNYDADQFMSLLENLLQDTDESYRQASEESGLDSAAISRYLSGTRPSRGACISLADHFRINPNDMLQAAGYETLHFFERRKIEMGQVRPRTAQILEKLEQITDPEVRERLYEVIDVVLDSHLQIERADPQKEPAQVAPEPSEAT